MIGFFPDPYPDELLFSACARYHERAGYRSRENTGRDLFGLQTVKVAIDLPGHLDSLLASLPHGHRHTADRLIDQNTLLPLYGPFVPQERLLRVREYMRGNYGGTIHMCLGAILTSKHDATFLRFCPLCVEADREQLGETYWHRLHNIPGINVCPIHKIFLEPSSVHIRYRGKRDEYLTAEQAVCRVPARTTEDANPLHQTYLRIAEDAAWLLKQRGLTADSTLNRARYIRLLFERGFSTYAGRVFTRELISSMKLHYSAQVLETVGCEIEKKCNWVNRLVQNTRSAQRPIQNLLFIQFLGCTAQEFFNLPTKSLPFGKGPWPCLNRASDHYKQSLITEYELSMTSGRTKSRKGTWWSPRPKGTFRCDCGFIYFRTGPDQSREARFEMSGYVALGRIWEDTFRQLYEEGYTYRQMAARLAVSNSTIKNKAVELGLITPSRTTIWAQPAVLTPVRKKRGAVKSFIDPKVRDSNRKILLDTVTANLSLGRSAIRRKLSTIYNWLLNNDEKWLYAHLPARLTSRKVNPVQVDWQARDKELAREVRKVASSVRSAVGRPVRVSATGIAGRIGKLVVISKYSDKLPLTVQALKEAAETVEEYAVRRVRWAATCYREEGMYRISRWKLQTRASLSHDVMKRPEVKSAIDEAVASLNL